MDKKIYKRDIFDEIIKYIGDDTIVVLHGARQVGKTYILYYLQNYLKNNKKNVYYVDLEDSRFVNVLNQGPDRFIKHLEEIGVNRTQDVFVLLDEIQNLKNPSNFLKLMVDHHKNIKLIVSGSSSFAIKSKFKDSLVGRTVDFEIFGLSFNDFLRFKNYKHIVTDEYTDYKIKEMNGLFKEFVLYSAYPKIILTQAIEKKEKYIQQIIDTYLKKDIRDLADIQEVEKFNKLLIVLADQSGNLLNVEELSNTCRLNKSTVDKYLFIMENTYIIKLVKPYYNNIRSELFKTPKIFFYDSGLQQMLKLKSLPKEIIGNSLETAIFGELIKKYGQENINFWRTTAKQEIDFIVQNKGKVLPIEVKNSYRDKAMRSLLYFNKKYNIDNLYCVTFNKDESAKHKNIKQIYPWQINEIEK
ncbi:MAG: ATP-binding protein [Candidatus Kuenenbacteria bacterium]